MKHGSNIWSRFMSKSSFIHFELFWRTLKVKNLAQKKLSTVVVKMTHNEKLMSKYCTIVRQIGVQSLTLRSCQSIQLFLISDTWCVIKLWKVLASMHAYNLNTRFTVLRYTETHSTVESVKIWHCFILANMFFGVFLFCFVLFFVCLFVCLKMKIFIWRQTFMCWLFKRVMWINSCSLKRQQSLDF